MIQRALTHEDYVMMFRRRWVLIFILTFVGGPLAYEVSRFLPNEYTSKTVVLVEAPNVPVDFVKPIDTTEVGQRLATMQEQILSRTRLEPIVREFRLYSQETAKTPMEDLIPRLQKAIKVTPVRPIAQTETKSVPGFSVSVTLDDPRIAQQVCTSITSMFIEENVRLRQQHSEETTTFLTQQLDDAKAKLDEKDARLAAFQRRYTGQLPDEGKANFNILMGLDTQLDAVTQLISRTQQEKSYAEAMLSERISDWKSSESGTNPEALDRQLASMQTQLAEAQAHYTDDYPDVVKLKHDIGALKKRIAERNDTKAGGDADPNAQTKPLTEPAQIQQLRAQIHNLETLIAAKSMEQEKIQQAIKQYQERVQASPSIEQEYKQLTRDYQTAEGFYNELLRKRAQSAMATDLERRQQGEQFRVLDPANLPDRPSFPNRPLFAGAGFACGLSLSLGIAFLLELRDTSVKSDRDIEHLLHLPVLAMIPTVESVSQKMKEVAQPPASESIELVSRS